MSKLVSKKMFFQFFTFIFLFALGFMTMHFLGGNEFHQQNLSEQQKLDKILFKTKLGKQMAFVNVQLELPQPAEADSDEVEILGYVTLLKSSDKSVSYQWILPEQVSLVEGSVEGTLNQIETEVPQTIKIRVKGFSKSDKRLISLSANTKIGNDTFANIALISSRPEDSYEFVANQNFQGKMESLDLSSTAPRDEKIQR